MSAWVILLVVVYPVLEWVVASWLAAQIGWAWVLVLVAVLFLLGVAVMRRAGFAAARSLRPVQVDGTAVMPGVTQDRISQAGREVGDAGGLFLAGLLIAVPGLLTSTVGLLLLVTPLRRFLGRALGRSVRRRAEAAGVRIDRRTTVQGRVVVEEVVVDEPGEARRPVRGEIVRGDVVPPEQPPSGGQGQGGTGATGPGEAPGA